MPDIHPNTAEQEVAFLRKLQRLLDEGDFSSTYKFALLQAFADLAVEHVPTPSGALTLTIGEIAEKFIEYYWRQAVPYQRDPAEIQSGTLHQNRGKAAKMLTLVSRARELHDGSLLRLRLNEKAWDRLLRDVSRVVRGMPLWRLQVVGGGTDEFLYRRADGEPGHIRLLPGVASAFRAFHPLITNLVRGAWVEQVRRIRPNRPLLGSAADLHDFLFRSDRRTLDLYRVILREYQRSRCFYCNKESPHGDADHFIPWSRYAFDLGHNFVFACSSCNNAKRDYLAHVDHLAHWHEANVASSAELAREFTSRGLVHDAARSEFVACWAYEQAQRAGAQGWKERGTFEPIDDRWRRIMVPFAAVAEMRPPYLGA